MGNAAHAVGNPDARADRRGPAQAFFVDRAIVPVLASATELPAISGALSNSAPNVDGVAAGFKEVTTQSLTPAG